MNEALWMLAGAVALVTMCVVIFWAWLLHLCDEPGLPVAPGEQRPE